MSIKTLIANDHPANRYALKMLIALRGSFSSAIHSFSASRGCQMLDGSGGVLFTQAFDLYSNPYASAGTNSTGFMFTSEQKNNNGPIFLRA